jgi:hypothetical protein
LSSYMGNDVLEKTVACMSKVKPDDWGRLSVQNADICIHCIHTAVKAS